MTETIFYLREFALYMGPLTCVMGITFLATLYYLTRR